MNAVEIEEEVSKLAAEPFDAVEFPWAFLRAFGNKETAIKRLKAGAAKSSDIPGGVLQQRHVHMAVAPPGGVDEMLVTLKASPKTAKGRVRFVLATDGEQFAAHDLESDDPLSCPYAEFTNHFGFFLPLAGISTVRQLKDNPIDIKATGRLNKLYLELIRENEEWGSDARRQDLNQFMARIIFCLFAEDTGIFFGDSLFTRVIRQMSDATNAHEVIGEMFRAMDTSIEKRAAGNFRPWADQFPYVNGGLFAGMRDVPRFSKMARSYLLSAGELDWKAINPDIFGSMIQGIADDDERGSLGLHYTSVPNILKVLDPLFLDDLREQLGEAGDNPRKLLNLRRRIASIRVFDPACGSGNFLIVAYIKLREIEAEIIRRRKDDKKSWLRLTNFYGIDIKHFAVETARLSLLIAEFQCDARMIGQMEACSNVLPLHKTGQVHCGNALRMDWLEMCPPSPKVWPSPEHAVASPGGDENFPVETYVCGNPPYLGAKKKSREQIEDMEWVGLTGAKLLDYVSAFVLKGAELVSRGQYSLALVATSSICQGEQVSLLWSRVLSLAHIRFAYTPFKWANSAANNAGVFCTIVGLEQKPAATPTLYSASSRKVCRSISPYLVEGDPVLCSPRKTPLSELPKMEMGSNPVDGKCLILTDEEYQGFIVQYPAARRFFRYYGGTDELVSGEYRRCVWIEDQDVLEAMAIPGLAATIEKCASYRRMAGRDARRAAKRPHAFCYSTYRNEVALHVGKVIGGSYDCIPAVLMPPGIVCSDMAFTIYTPFGYELGIISSKLHRVWAEAIAGRLGNGIRYANTVVYNTFPIPPLTANQKGAMTVASNEILLAREAHYPQPFSELYRCGQMPDDLKAAHARNDETLERIYIGRRFRNDTERLEKLFDLYTKMTKDTPAKGAA